MDKKDLPELPKPDGCMGHEGDGYSQDRVYGHWPAFSDDQMHAYALAAVEKATAELRRDAGRYRWLRDHACNSLHLERDGDHACNYMTASDWIDNSPEWYTDDDPAEVQRMRETGTIWRLQIYPNTPVGFNVWNGASLEYVIDAAIASTGGTK